MNDEKFHKNVDDIEFKCNELISEINDHLTLYCKPRTANFDNKQTINNDEESVIPDVVITTCHNKLINFALNHYEARKIHKSKNTGAVRIHIPKNLCAGVTKINQILIPGHIHHSKDETDLLDSNLEVHHLKHVNIDPRLTKQVAFKISCQNERKLTYRNVGTFNVIHDDTVVEKELDLKQQTSPDLEKNQSSGEDDFHEASVTCEQNIDTEIKINLKHPTSEEVRHFLYGKICKKMAGNSPTRKRSIKVLNRKIKSK